MKRITALLFTLVLAVGLASAQTQVPNAPSTSFLPYVEGTISSSPNSSANVNYNVGLGLEVNTQHLLLDASGVFNTASVAVGTGSNGYSGILQAQGYLKFAKLGSVTFLGGGGANWAINTDGFQFKKFVSTATSTANPFVGGGVQVGKFRSIFTYQFDTDTTIPGQHVYQLQSQYQLTKNLYALLPISINQINNGPTVTQVGGGLKYTF